MEEEPQTSSNPGTPPPSTPSWRSQLLASPLIAPPAPTFTSSFGDFNLASPRHLPPPSPGTMAMPIDAPLDSYPLFHARTPAPTAFAPSQPSPFFNAFSTAAFRKQSLLASQEPLYPKSAMSPPVDGEGGNDGGAVADDDGENEERDGSDSPMVLGSPTFETPIMGGFGPPGFNGVRQSRSRSTSESMSINGAQVGSPPVPPGFGIGGPASPATIARALHQGQRTPPPFLQRRLYNGMTEEEGSNSSSSSREREREGLPMGKPRNALGGDDEMEMGLGLEGTSSKNEGTGSGSGSGSEDSRVVRRAVSRRPNLLPKTKSHLRVLSQLRTEDGPVDVLEIASEATLHRLARSGASNVPPPRTTPLTPFTERTIQPKPTPNRFPESVDDDDLQDASLAGGSSGDEGEDVGEAGSDWGGMSMGYGTEDEEERKLWTGIRAGNGNAIGVPIGGSNGRSPGSEKGKMEVEAPSTPSWQSSSRPGKRKMVDDRFEPYAQAAFKRRAVSPAASAISNGLGSPILSVQSGVLPTPPPLPLSIGIPSASLTLPVSIPSPTSLGPHHSFFSNINAGGRSRAGSPSASSLSSSAGRGPSFLMSNQALGMTMKEKEKEELDRLGGMSLG